MALWVSVGGIAFSRIHFRFRPVHLMQLSVLACVLGVLLAAFVSLWPASILLGIGVGIASAAGDSYLLGSVTAKDVARAAAVQETSFAVGSALGVALAGGIFASTNSVTVAAVTLAALTLLICWTFRYNRGTLTA